MTLEEIRKAVVALEQQIIELPAQAPELSDVIGQVRTLQEELERTRGALGPLVPDAESPRGIEEKEAEELGSALGSLLTAATVKHGPGDATPSA